MSDSNSGTQNGKVKVNKPNKLSTATHCIETSKPASTSEFECVPVIDVHTNNIRNVWPSLMLGIQQASFIGLDLVGQFLKIQLLIHYTLNLFRSLVDLAIGRT